MPKHNRRTNNNTGPLNSGTSANRLTKTQGTFEEKAAKVDPKTVALNRSIVAMWAAANSRNNNPQAAETKLSVNTNEEPAVPGKLNGEEVHVTEGSGTGILYVVGIGVCLLTMMTPAQAQKQEQRQGARHGQVSPSTDGEKTDHIPPCSAIIINAVEERIDPNTGSRLTLGQAQKQSHTLARHHTYTTIPPKCVGLQKSNAIPTDKDIRQEDITVWTQYTLPDPKDPNNPQKSCSIEVQGTVKTVPASREEQSTENVFVTLRAPKRNPCNYQHMTILSHKDNIYYPSTVVSNPSTPHKILHPYSAEAAKILSSAVPCQFGIIELKPLAQPGTNFIGSDGSVIMSGGVKHLVVTGSPEGCTGIQSKDIINDNGLPTGKKVIQLQDPSRKGKPCIVYTNYLQQVGNNGQIEQSEEFEVGLPKGIPGVVPCEIGGNKNKETVEFAYPGSERSKDPSFVSKFVTENQRKEGDNSHHPKYKTNSGNSSRLAG